MKEEILYKNIKNGEIDIVRSNYKLFWEGEKKKKLLIFII